jgi:hypothetical protein
MTIVADDREFEAIRAGTRSPATAAVACPAMTASSGERGQGA